MSDQRPKRRGSSVGLVEDLLRKPEDSFREQLIENAMKGVYHDFRSTHATPKLLLNDHLMKFGYTDLAKRARRGEYDDQPDDPETMDAELEAMLKANPSMAEIDRRFKAGELSPSEATRLMAEEMVKLHKLSDGMAERLMKEVDIQERPPPSRAVFQIEGVYILPSSDNNEPPFTQVHIALDVTDSPARLAIRFKSRGGVEAFCRDLMKTADIVWPKESA